MKKTGWAAQLRNKHTRIEVFRTIPVNEQGFVLLDLPAITREKIINELKNKELTALINYLDPDEAGFVLSVLSNYRKKKIFSELGEHIRSKTEYLLKFDPKTAASMMSLHYIEVDKNTTVEEALKQVERHEKETGKIPTMLVVENGLLVGELSLHRLVLRKKNEKIASHIRRVQATRYDREQHEIIKMFERHPHGKIVVLDDDKSILGVIYSNDILRLIHSQTAQSLRDFAGINKEEDVEDSALTKVKYRYRWLILNLFTAFLAAAVVGLFEDTISRLVLLAAYLPIVAGMGGNAGTQTLAVTVRGLALREIDSTSGKRIVINEMMAGVTNGAITGLIAALIATFWNGSAMLGVVIGSAMVINLLIAGFFGTVIPILMRKIGKDPASSATIFITTATDVFGFLAFLGLATILM